MGAWRQPGGLSVFCSPPPPDPNPAHHHQRPPAPHTPLPHPLIWHLLSASLLPPASLDVLSGDLRPPRLPDKRRWCGSWGSREIVRGRTLRAHPVAGAKLIRTLQPTPERRAGVWQRARRLRTTHPSCHIRHIRVTPLLSEPHRSKAASGPQQPWIRRVPRVRLPRLAAADQRMPLLPRPKPAAAQQFSLILLPRSSRRARGPIPLPFLLIFLT